jgi:hypothetical protein
MTPPRLDWTAGRSGVAHAGRGRDPRTLCGQLRTAPHFAWPAASRCAECVRLAVASGDLEPGGWETRR